MKILTKMSLVIGSSKQMEAPMLLRTEHIPLLTGEDQVDVLKNYQRAYVLRLLLPAGLKSDDPAKGDYWVPSCHVVAHAFARTFNLLAVDGEHTYAERNVPSEKTGVPEVHFTTCIHSWIEFKTVAECHFLLDLFPDVGCSIMPVLLEAPHPAYWIPTDEKFLEVIQKVFTQKFEERVEELSSEMTSLAREHCLL